MDFVNLQNKDFSFFGPGCHLSGKFHLSGVIKMSAHLEGQLFITAPGKITIERDGIFFGSIHCQDIEVFGEVQGEIHSSGRVVIQSSAKVKGRIQTKNLSIFPGARVNIEGHTKEEGGA